MNQISVEISSNNVVQILLIILWSLSVYYDFCTEAVRCFVSHTIWENPQEIPRSHSLCVYLFLNKTLDLNTEVQCWCVILFGVIWQQHHPFISCLHISKFWEKTWSCRMICVARGLKEHLVPTTCHGQGHFPLRTPSIKALNTAWDGGHP